MEKLRLIGWVLGTATFAALLPILGAANLPAIGGKADPKAGAKTADKTPAGAEVKPRWKKGDQWVVQSASQVLQAGADQQDPVKVDWQFTVEQTEPVDDAECFKVKIQCQMTSPRPQPETVIWVDAKTYAMKQIQTQLAVQGEMRTITEKFVHNQAQPAPVFVPLTVVPLEMPVFLDDGIKATEFNYTAVQPTKGVPAKDQVGFAFRVQQKVTVPSADLMKSTTNERFSKNLTKTPTLLFEISTGKKSVKQIWQQGQPWAVYSDNGRTQSRLVSFTPGS